MTVDKELWDIALGVLAILRTVLEAQKTGDIQRVRDILPDAMMTHITKLARDAEADRKFMGQG